MSKLNNQQRQVKGLNILVCGSQRFDDPAFVFQMLSLMYHQFNGAVRTIYTTKFAGSCEFARIWAETTNQSLSEDKKIKVVDYLFDSVLEPKNNSLYEEMEIPTGATQRSDFFQEVKEKIVSMGVNVVLAFPNKEGELGVSTKNICLASKMCEPNSSIKILECDKALKALSKKAEEKLQQEQVKPVENKLGFTNKL